MLHSAAEEAGTVSDDSERPIRIVLAEPDPAWPARFAREAERIRAALGRRALAIEHVGSTSVPGLAAKPVIDVVLVVEDAADEPSYTPPLEAAGYVLHKREPDRHQHRFFKATDSDVHLHVFSEGCPEVGRMLLFRDHLRRSSADRELYLQAKRALAQREWRRGQEYADAKSPVVEEILSRAGARDT